MVGDLAFQELALDLFLPFSFYSAFLPVANGRGPHVKFKPQVNVKPCFTI